MADEPGRPLSSSLQRHADLDTWIRVEVDGTVVFATGKVELGQGLINAIARIGAEELDVPLDRVRVETADTARGPNELYTVGSQSLEDSGTAVRQAAAEARQVMLEMASTQLGAPVAQLDVEDGVVRARGSQRSISYAELIGGKRFDRKITGEAVPKSPDRYRILGLPGTRMDLPDKLRGGAFLCDLELPDMLHGRVVRPPGYGASLVSIDLEAAGRCAGVVAVVRDGSFVGVVAEREEQAVRAREVLHASARWDEPAALPTDGMDQHLLRMPARSFAVHDGVALDGEVPPLHEPPRSDLTLVAEYYRPPQMHAAIGPSAAIAWQTKTQLMVWSHSQGVAVLRPALAEALGIAADTVRVIHAPGPGCYGHNGADDAALDAALLARAVPSRPVRLQWMRDDEHAWEPYAPAMVVKMRASVRGGKVIDWNHEVWSNSHMGRPIPYGDRSNLLAAWHRAAPLPPPDPTPRLEPQAGIHRNADPLYAFPDKRIVKHFVEDAPLRCSSTRGLGAFANVFAIESFMDELADRAGYDPLAFRLRHLVDERARAVLAAVSQRAGWRAAGGGGRGQGLAFARYKNSKCYAAIVVDLEVDLTTGAIRLLRAVIAADAGQVVDPDGLANQLEGGFVQAASWTLKEEVKFDASRITSRDWESYPILTFPEIPAIETVLLDRPGEPWLGSGEATTGPTPAAIANAVFHATGRRLRRIPFTPARVQAALETA